MRVIGSLAIRLCGFAAVCLLIGWQPRLSASELLDQETARQLRLRGEIVPVSDILQQAESLGVVEILELELEKEGKDLVYEIEALSHDKRVIELYFDAKSGDLLKFKTGSDEVSR